MTMKSVLHKLASTLWRKINPPVYCAQCNLDLNIGQRRDDWRGPIVWRLKLSNDKVQFGKKLDSPPLCQDFYFCGLGCLKTWVSVTEFKNIKPEIR